MAEAPAQVWLRQAISDWQTSENLFDQPSPVASCQTIGKQQQAVEKAVKAVLAALREKKLVNAPTTGRHTVEVEINHILSAVRRSVPSRKTIDLVRHVHTFFNAKNIGEINELCALAPKWPSPGQLFRRNTEYPFESAANTWAAPADTVTFSASESRKFRHIATKIVGGAGQIVSAAKR